MLGSNKWNVFCIQCIPNGLADFPVSFIKFLGKQNTDFDIRSIICSKRSDSVSFAHMEYDCFYRPVPLSINHPNKINEECSFRTYIWSKTELQFRRVLEHKHELISLDLLSWNGDLEFNICHPEKYQKYSKCRRELLFRSVV